MPELSGRHGGAVTEHDGGGDVLAQPVVRDRERRRLDDVRVLEQRDVDLARRHLLTTAVDQLLEPPGDGEVAVFVEAPLIAGAEPSVDERRLVRSGVVDVPGHH